MAKRVTVATFVDEETEASASQADNDLRSVTLEFLTSRSDDREEFIALVTKVIDLLYEELVNRKSCFSGQSPEKLRSLFTIHEPPDQVNYSQDDLIRILRDVARHSVNLTTPMSLAYMSGAPLKISVVADLVASVLNQSLDTWDQSPAATEVERAVIAYIRNVCGLQIKAGWMTAGGTISNLQAIVSARESKIKQLSAQSYSGYRANAGRYTLLSRLRAFCCEETHFSIEKGLHLAGFDDETLIKIPSRKDGGIDTSLLASAVEKQVRLANIPFLIVGTAGTTNLGAIDELRTIGALAKKYSSWFHVDAAHGGACLFSKKHRKLLAGLELATSVTLDGHKLLYQPVSCGVLLFLKKSDQPDIPSNLSVPPYLNSSNVLFEDAYDSYPDTVQTTRRFDALKLYLCLRLLSPNFLSELVESRVGLAKNFWHALSKEPDFEAVEPRLNIVVFRYRPNGLDEKLVDELNAMVWRHTFLSGELLLSLTKHRGHTFLRAVIMNPLTTSTHLAKMLVLIRRSAEQLIERGSNAI